MSGRNRGKAKIQITKPEPPPFLQRMREQIVANEDAERKEESERKRKNKPRGSDDPEDAPTVVRIGDEDLTEEEYKRLKLELDSQYRLDDKKADKIGELDIDELIQSRTEMKPDKQEGDTARRSASSKQVADWSRPKKATATSKQLSYGGSSDDDDDE